MIDCTLHPKLDGVVKIDEEHFNYCSLKDICNHISNYGLLGSNKVNDSTLKLYPDKSSQKLVDDLKENIEKTFNITGVEIMIYGDGCFKDATSGVWCFADPVISPAHTQGLDGYPYELKLKYLADEDKYSGIPESTIQKDIITRIAKKYKGQEVAGDETQGTTPNSHINILGTLMDLISGSGDKGTPVVIIQNYFNNYSHI